MRTPSITDKLAENRELLSHLKFKLNQSCLRVAHYEDCIQAVMDHIRRLQNDLLLHDGIGSIEKRLNEWIKRLNEALHLAIKECQQETTRREIMERHHEFFQSRRWDL